VSNEILAICRSSWASITDYLSELFDTIFSPGMFVIALVVVPTACLILLSAYGEIGQEKYTKLEYYSEQCDLRAELSAALEDNKINGVEFSDMKDTCQDELENRSLNVLKAAANRKE